MSIEFIIPFTADLRISSLSFTTALLCNRVATSRRGGLLLRIVARSAGGVSWGSRNLGICRSKNDQNKH